MNQIKDDKIKSDKDLEIALKEYELATQHYLHEDKMKTDALRNSLLAIIAIFAAVATAISTNNTTIDSTTNKIKIWFSIILGLSGILISFSYGIQYRRILKHQEAREARLEEIERVIENSSHFPIQTIRYGLELIEQKRLHIQKNEFKPCIAMGFLESWSSSIWFKFLVPWFLIILWVLFLAILLLIYRF